jgi:hypothetical protein
MANLSVNTSVYFVYAAVFGIKHALNFYHKTRVKISRFPPKICEEQWPVKPKCCLGVDVRSLPTPLVLVGSLKS